LGLELVWEDDGRNVGWGLDPRLNEGAGLDPRFTGGASNGFILSVNRDVRVDGKIRYLARLAIVV
jgi:hypothetical protein